MKQQIAQLFEKEMNRKEFLQHLGFGLAGLIGAQALLRGLTDMNSRDSAQKTGYGSTPYGGNR